MTNLLSLLASSDAAPPGIPVWVWSIATGLAVLVVMKVLPLAAERWVQKQKRTTPIPPPPRVPTMPTPVPASVMEAHEKADADRHEDVRRMFEESRRANDEMKKTAAAIVRMVTRVHSRLVRIETKIDPDAPAADLTGEHESVQ